MIPDRRRRRAALGVALGAAAIMLAACAAPGTTPNGRTASAAVPGSVTPATPATTTADATSTTLTPSGDGTRDGVLPSTRIEPPTDADRPDGPAPTPDEALTAADLATLIRVDASAPAAQGRCTPADVRLSMSGFDGAAGHRFAMIVATNVSQRSCTLLGWPGLGFRGAWGTAFPVIAERSATTPNLVGVDPSDPTRPAALDPGGRAFAYLEWTGARAGAQQEPVSLIAVRLASGGPVARLAVRADDHVDIGEDTTVRVWRWLPIEPSAARN